MSAAPSSPDIFAAALLAGGKSSRMGTDKALLDWQGEPMWRVQLRKLAVLSPARLLLSCRREQGLTAVELGAEPIFDPPDNPGPLGAIIACLEAAQMPLLVLAVDMPGMTPEFLRALLEISGNVEQGVVCRSAHGFEPLAALYVPSALPLLRQQVVAGNFRMQAALELLVGAGLARVRELRGDEVLLFRNANTPQEYAAWKTPRAASITLTRLEHGVAAQAADLVAREEPLEIRVEGRSIAVVMRTPGHDEDLAAGFLLSEGVIKKAADIFEISLCPSTSEGGNVADVLLAGVAVNWDSLTRHVFASSSCGVCGKATIDSVFMNFPPVTAALQIPATLLQSLPAKLRAAQETFEQTGGLHASAIFDHEGNLLVLREDVGRHNALDKVLGHALRHGLLPLDQHLLMVSGRVSFEIMQKALAGGIPIIAAISAPSTLAVDFAQGSGQTLVGFLRGDRMNVYAHPQRLLT